PPRKGSAMTGFYPRPPAEQMKNSFKAPRILRAFPATPCFRSPLSEESPSGLCFGCAQKAVGESLMLNFQRSRRAFWFVAFAVIMGALPVRGQEPFPPGVEGELYYCPRIDLNPAKDGGPLAIELDGLLDDDAWQRAAFHHYLSRWPGGVALSGAELNSAWAAVADEEFLYVAWRTID